MARYIDADKAEERFKEIYCDDCDSRNGIKCRACGLRDGADVFSDAPTEDVQPVIHAKWEYNPINFWKCSNCGVVVSILNDTERKKFHKFCSRCGAKMDEEPEEG